MNWYSFFFLLFSTLACMFALGVVLSSNIVRMAIYLVASLTATSGLFFLAGADFVGAMQLMIYVGGTLVLIAFGVMLTAQGPFLSMQTRAGEWILATIIGGCLLAILVQTAFQIGDWNQPAVAGTETPSSSDPTATQIGMGLLGVRVDALANEQVAIGAARVETEASQAASTTTGTQPAPASNLNSDTARTGPNATAPVGTGTLSGYLLPFEIISIHLLVVLIGAAYLARAKRRAVARTTAR